MTDNTKRREPLSDIRPDESERFYEVLQSLEQLIEKQTSLRFAFLRGAVYGLGTVLGATLLLALFGGLIVATVSSLSEIPLIGQFIQEEALQEYSEDGL